MLKIENPKDRIQIERAHRMGNRSAGKIRPIIAKFVLSGHKATVKSAFKFNPIMVEGYAALFSCTAVVQASDSMTASM